MIEFLFAASPWVLMGIALAILCARLGGSKGKQSKKLENSMALGLALGLMFAPALNSIGLWENHGIGFALGPLWGMTLALLGHRRNGSREE